MSKTYGAASGDGTINSSGMTREQAMRRAQEIADKTGEPAEVYAEPAQEGDEPVAVVQPAVVSHTYYAVCNANGPISVRLDGNTDDEAIAAFAALDGRAAIDGASTDAEDDLEIDGDGMSEADFAAALEAAGAEHVKDLSPIVNAHAGTVAHLADGWSLWRVARDSVHCECGEWSGEACQWHGPESETVVVEYMPEHLRESHRAARNSGVYPHNGAVRLRVERSCADRIVEHAGEWARVL